MFAVFTVAVYLILGSVAARFFFSAESEISINSKIINTFKAESIVAEEMNLDSREMKFDEIKIKKNKRLPVRKPAVENIVPEVIEEVVMVEEVRALSDNELPFYETVVLSAVEMKEEIKTDLLARYSDFKFDENLVAEAKTETISDEVKTVSAQATEVEPEFFDYKAVKDSAVAETEPIVYEKEIVDARPVTDSTETNFATEDMIDEDLIAYDYSPAKKTKQAVTAPVTTQQVIAGSVAPVAAAKPDTKLFGFDYSNATAQSPKVSSQASQASSGNSPGQSSSREENGEENNIVPNNNKSGLKKMTFSSTLMIQAHGTDLKRIEELNSFEVRFPEDDAETRTDYGTGEVTIKEILAHSKMTRNISVIKRGYTPTWTDIILEEGKRIFNLPLIDEQKFNSLMESYQGGIPVGAFLVELDDETALAQLDVPFGKVLTLNGDYKSVKTQNYRYQLFLGVRAGNAMVTFKKRNGETSRKIIHIHENELTFDANYYEDIANDKVRLYEVDLLSKVPSPLIMAANDVRVFATERTSEKTSNNGYRLNFGLNSMGGRRYMELGHQSEPVFVGIRDNNNVKVPSENFMRHVLSKVDGGKLGDRCLVQINLRETAVNIEIGNESVESTLMTYVQMLDDDGKFYDSLSEKSEKVIVYGESHASGRVPADGRINIKIEYVDGSKQFLNSYCSPNTYLVEQL